jgi:alanine racemase
MHRRSFMLSAAAAVVAPVAALRSAARSAQPRDSSFDPWIEVHAAHFAQNAAEVARANGGVPIMAVIKNNGYGLGLVPAARALAAAPQVAALAVVKLQEAMALRDAGITQPLLLMGPYDTGDLSDLIARDIMPMVYAPIGDDLQRAAALAGRRIRVHVKVDTGLGRIGVPYRGATAFIRDLARRPGVELGGVMMTFTEDQQFDREQLRRFEALASDLTQAGVKVGLRHAASTYTFFQHDHAALDMVRPGMALLGIYPEPRFRAMQKMALRPAGAFRTRVIYVKQLQPGESAGYERAYMATEPVWIATLPVGHADGWPRAAAKGARIRIGQRLHPVIASVSASHTLVEIGREPVVHVGDVATLWDWQEGSRPEDVAAACGASVYDLTMHLGGHLRRTTAAAG